MEGRYPTPEDAALATFDPRYAQVMEIVFFGPDEAEVELATNEEPYLYPYFVQCRRVVGGWIEGASGNGPRAR